MSLIVNNVLMDWISLQTIQYLERKNKPAIGIGLSHWDRLQSLG